ncbi:MAG: DUF2254 domain-containing protein, partial [Gemmatimonadetes bacterium]|nr:DUF2254 domain-containing protein [Gemmatimonadota bacterium]
MHAVMTQVLARVRRLWSGLVSGYWFIPTAIVVLASAIALGLVELDSSLHSRGSRFGFTGGPDSAQI